jgi:N-acetylglucosamine-6-phosphate deacetylase
VRLGVEAAVVDGELVPGDVEIEDGFVVAVGRAGPGHGIACAGFVDLQVNGYGGIDLLAADEAGVLALGERLLTDGVVAYQPTLITSPPYQTQSALTAIGIPLPAAVEAVTRVPAGIVGRSDLGRLLPGVRADPEA